MNAFIRRHDTPGLLHQLRLPAVPQDARSQLTASTAQRAVQVKIVELQAKARKAVAANAALVKARMVNPEVRGLPPCPP